MYDAVCVLSSAVRNRCVGVCTCFQRFSLTGLGLAPASGFWLLALVSGFGFNTYSNSGSAPVFVFVLVSVPAPVLPNSSSSSLFPVPVRFLHVPGFAKLNPSSRLCSCSLFGPCQTPAPDRFQLRVQSQSQSQSQYSMAQVVMRSPAYKERLRWGIRPGFYRSESAIFVRKWTDGRFYRSDGV